MNRAHLTLLAVVASTCFAARGEAEPPKLSPVTNEMRAHVIKPAHLANARSIAGLPAAKAGIVVSKTPPSTQLAKHLDVGQFGKDLNTALKSAATGYAMQIRHHGKIVETGIWNWSQTPADASKGWSFDTRMHIASVSKLMTGIALYKLLDAKGIPITASIEKYLPTYWAKGPNVDKIRFVDLMQHKSGFYTGGSGSDYELMKSKVQQGVTTAGEYAYGTYHYENMNYGLARILIPIINGDVAQGMMFPTPFQEVGWDYVTIKAYESYVQKNVFSPAGVTDASLDSRPTDALAYGFYPDNGKGWDSGNLTTMAGGAAWHMTLNDVIKVMGTLRRGGAILPANKALTLLESDFGIDWSSQTPAGTLYTKNGLWWDGNHTQQDVVFFLPDDLELVVFVNSPVGKTPPNEEGPGIWLSGLVQNIYLGALH